MTPMTSPLYEFTEDSAILEGTIKLVVILGEPPRATTIMIDFLAVNYPSTFNGVLGRPLLRALKVVMLIHFLTMKFSTTAGTYQVRGRQRDFRECYNRSLELAKKRTRTAPGYRGRKTSRGPMETNIEPLLHEDESIVGLVEELTKI